MDYYKEEVKDKKVLICYIEIKIKIKKDLINMIIDPNRVGITFLKIFLIEFLTLGGIFVLLLTIKV